MENFSEICAKKRGKMIFVLAENCPAELCRGAEFIFAGTENFVCGKTFFEMISAPLAAAGTPWEEAREHIERELAFWFGESGDGNAPFDAVSAGARTATAGDEASQRRLALARALAARATVQGATSAPLAVSASLLAPELFQKLRERARQENFALVAWGKTLPAETVFLFDFIAVFADSPQGGNCALLQTGTAEEIFRNPENLAVAQKIFAGTPGARGNVFSGKILGAGAGEFFAETPAGEIHGRLCGANFDKDFPAGTPIEIFVRAENFHADAFPPEENAFEVSAENVAGETTFDGRVFAREFRLPSGAGTVQCASLSRQTLEIPPQGPLFLWFFPEDALGFPVDPAGV